MSITIPTWIVAVAIPIVIPAVVFAVVYALEVAVTDDGPFRGWPSVALSIVALVLCLLAVSVWGWIR